MRKWYPLFLIVVTLVASVILYPRMPETIPIHWNIHGEVDDYGNKFVGLFLLPIVMIGLWGLMRALPRIDPHHENYAKMQRAYDLVVNTALTIMALTHVVIIAVTLGAPLSLPRLMPALVGAMLIVIGNVLPQARPNWFFGVRTPWTLSNPRVWERTHRVAGYSMVAAGVIGIVVTALPLTVAFPAIVAMGIIAGVVPVIYSYVAYRDEASKATSKQELSK